MASEDLFEDLHKLEETYYADGYALGLSDGSRAGRIEGRTFGLEKGYEKFFEMGRLAGKSQVLEARLPSLSPHTSTTTTTTIEEVGEVIEPLPKNERLAKHIRTLSALTEHESLSTTNDEDSVSEFDDRFKRAVAKAKVIENIIGGSSSSPAHVSGSATNNAKGAERNIEDFGVGVVAAAKKT